MLIRLILLILCAWPTLASAQQEMRSSTKGASTPLPITGTVIDADHNALDVKCLSGCAGGGGGGASSTDDAAFTPGTDAVTPAGFMFDDVAPDSVNEGDIGVGRMSANRNQYTTIRDSAGNERGANVNSSNELLTNANTEMPAAVTLADDTANPTVPGVAAFNMCFDGTNWDLCTKATAGQGAVDTATQRVTLARGSTACPNYIAISQTADTTLVSGTSSQYFYICSIILVAGAAEVVSLWEGTGTACGTGSTAILGSTTEANGLSISANGGFSAVSGVPFLRTATTANDLCLRQSGTSRVSGVITYYKAP